MTPTNEAFETWFATVPVSEFGGITAEHVRLAFEAATERAAKMCEAQASMCEAVPVAESACEECASAIRAAGGAKA